MGRRKAPTHDQLIKLVARRAAEEGADEESCPYIYDLRARKIWLKEFRTAKKEIENGKVDTTHRTPRMGPEAYGKKRERLRAERRSREVAERQSFDD